MPEFGEKILIYESVTQSYIVCTISHLSSELLQDFIEFCNVFKLL